MVDEEEGEYGLNVSETHFLVLFVSGDQNDLAGESEYVVRIEEIFCVN